MRNDVILAATAIAGLATMPLFAQDAAKDDWHVVSPGNTWSITDSTCALNAAWGGDIEVIISLHDDHHDLGIYNPHFTGVVDNKVVTLHYGAGGPAAKALPNGALGHRDAKTASYVADIHGDLFDRIARSKSMQVYRAGATLVDLDMTGFPAALAAMNACEAGLAAASASNAANQTEGENSNAM